MELIVSGGLWLSGSGLGARAQEEGAQGFDGVLSGLGGHPREVGAHHVRLERKWN